MSEFLKGPWGRFGAVAGVGALAAALFYGPRVNADTPSIAVEEGSAAHVRVRCDDNFCESGVVDDRQGFDYSLVRYEWCEGKASVTAYSAARDKTTASPPWSRWWGDPRCKDGRMNADDFKSE